MGVSASPDRGCLELACWDQERRVRDGPRRALVILLLQQPAAARCCQLLPIAASLTAARCCRVDCCPQPPVAAFVDCPLLAR